MSLQLHAKLMLLSRASGWGRCLKVLLSWLCNDCWVRALAALYIDLCPLTSLTASTRCWHRVDITSTSYLHYVYTVLTSCIHLVDIVSPPWRHSCNNSNLCVLHWYEQHYLNFSPSPTETDLRILIFDPGLTDLIKSQWDWAQISRQPWLIPYSHLCYWSWHSFLCCVQGWQSVGSIRSDSDRDFLVLGRAWVWTWRSRRRLGSDRAYS